MALDIVTVALLTPVIIASAGEYAFPLVAIAADPNEDIFVQGAPVFLDDEGLGLGVATVPVTEGRADYVIRVEHGPIIQEVPVIVIGKKRPDIAWWLCIAPLSALLFSIRVRRLPVPLRQPPKSATAK